MFEQSADSLTSLKCMNMKQAALEEKKKKKKASTSKLSLD